MKDLNSNTTKGINSLGLKFSALVFFAILLAGFTLILTLTVFQQKTTLAQEQQLLDSHADLLFKQFERSLSELEAKALRAHQLIVRQLTLSDAANDAVKALTQLEDGSRRHVDEYSGLFIAPLAKVTARDPEVQRTAVIWQQLMPLLQQDFFSVLYISKKNFVRAAPADWVNQLSNEIRLIDNPLFQQVTPENNPQRVMQWTPIYYDNIWQHWLIGLVLPVYQQEQLIGAVIFNLKLADVLAHRIPPSTRHRAPKMLILNSDDSLLQTSLDAVTSNALPMFANYSGGEITPASLQKTVLQQPAALIESSIDSEYLFAITPQGRLGLRFVLYETKSELMQQQQYYRIPLVMLTFLLALGFTLLLYLRINKILLQRLKKLAMAVNKVGRGLQPCLQLDNQSDELGQLNRAFTGMFEEINQLVSGLDRRIAEKEQAELLARKLSKAVAYSSSGIVITNHQLEIEYLNPFLTELLGLELAQMQGKPLTQLFSADMQQLSAEMMHTLKERQHWRGDVLLQQDLAKSVVQLWVTLTIAPIRDEKGALSHFVGALQDISFIKQSQKQMEQLAYFDSLTGLANRSYFRNQLDRKSVV